MSPIDYIRIPVELFTDRKLSDTQRHILGLVTSFNGKGFMLSNRELAGLLSKSQNHIGDCIADLFRQGYIKIENAQSRYRRIYLPKNPEVEIGTLPEKPVSKTVKNEILLPEKSGLLPEISGSTSGKTSNITKELKKLKRARANSFTPPTADEVATYAKSIRYSLDGKLFIDSYESKGWMIGKQKMRDWKAAVRTWQRREDILNSQQEPAPFDHESARQRELLLKGTA